MFIFAVVS